MTRSASATAAVAAVVLAAVLATAGSAGTTAAGPPSGAALAALAQPGADSSLATDRIYFVMTDRYANGDPSNDMGGLTGGRSTTGFDPTSTAFWHGGDFKGLTGGCTDPVHGLQRIKNLGFNAIWVTPAVVNQILSGSSAGYHGYWGLDFTRVDPHLGTDQDFADFVDCAHSLGMKVILDVVVNHTGDVVELSGGSTYSAAPDRNCHGKVFNPAKFVGTNTFPCQSARSMPHIPLVLPSLAHAKKPDWLNDPLNYHDRGDIDFSSCNEACYENGDFYGLDDLFTEKPVVEKGLAQIYAGWVTTYKLDGFRVDTARHVNAGFFKLWVPQILAAAKSAGVNDFQIFGEVPITDTVEQSAYVRDRGLPSVLDFPFQSSVTGYASGGSSAVAVLHRMQDDDYYRLPDGSDPTPPTFLGNHDMGRAAYEIALAGGGLSGRRAAPASGARLRPDLSPARRSGRLLRRRGRDDRHRRRPGFAAGHVPDAGAGLADAAARRQPADRHRLLVRRDDRPARARAEAARHAARRRSGARRRGRRSSASRRAGCSRSAASTRPGGASISSCSTTEPRRRARP